MIYVIILASKSIYNFASNLTYIFYLPTFQDSENNVFFHVTFMFACCSLKFVLFKEYSRSFFFEKKDLE